MEPARVAAIGCLLVLAGGCGSSPTGPTPEELTYQATAGSQRAVFLFPLENKPVWDWNLGSTQDNALEYMWAVELQNGSASYQFGFFLFKFPGRQPERGDLQRLLQAGQHSVAVLLASGAASVVADASVSVGQEGQYLAIAVDDPHTLSLLLSERPREVVFRAEVPGKPGIRRVVQVRYGS